MTEIRYVKNGFASNFGDYIELNENLKNYPKLHRQVLAHELGHTNKPFSKEDFIHDLKDTNVNQKEALKFMIKHPRAFLQLVPVYYSKDKGWVMDPNMLITYFFAFGAIGGAIALALIYL